VHVAPTLSITEQIGIPRNCRRRALLIVPISQHDVFALHVLKAIPMKLKSESHLRYKYNVLQVWRMHDSRYVNTVFNFL
jgi:hypothetical protein